MNDLVWALCLVSATPPQFPLGSCLKLAESAAESLERNDDTVDVAAGLSSDLEDETRERSVPFDLVVDRVLVNGDLLALVALAGQTG